MRSFPPIVIVLLGLLAAGSVTGQTDVVRLRSSDTATDVPRLIVTTSTSTTGLADVRIQQSRFRLSTNAILNVGTFAPATGLAGDLRYSGGSLLYHDGAAWQTLTSTSNAVVKQPAAAQSASAATPLIHLDESGGSSPNLLEIEVGGVDTFVVANDGAVTSGIWKGQAVAPTYGGTGLTTLGAAGRILYSTSASSMATLTVGASGTYLRSNGATPTWSSLLASDLPGGSSQYIQNQNAADQAASFRIGGTGSINSAATTGLAVTNSIGVGADTYAAQFVGTQTAGGLAFTSHGVYGEGRFGAGVNPGAARAIGGYFLGNHAGFGDAQADAYGVYARGTGITGRHKYGIYATADSTSTYANYNEYAVYAEAFGNPAAVDTAYGIYATASGGDVNWAGYFVGDVAVTSTADPGLTLGSGSTAYFQLGDSSAKIYRNGAGSRIFVRAEATDNVAQFASYGLYLPLDPGISLYTGGDIRLGYASGADDDTIYWDAGNETIRWEDANGRFSTSDDLYVGGAIQCNDGNSEGGMRFGDVLIRTWNIQNWITTSYGIIRTDGTGSRIVLYNNSGGTIYYHGWRNNTEVNSSLGNGLSVNFDLGAGGSLRLRFGNLNTANTYTYIEAIAQSGNNYLSTFYRISY